MMLMPKRDFDLFGDDFFRDDFFKGEKNNLMKTDIKETENSYILDVDLPGYNKEDIKVDITDGYLTINAKMSNEVHDEKKGKFAVGDYLDIKDLTFNEVELTIDPAGEDGKSDHGVWNWAIDDSNTDHTIPTLTEVYL